MPPRETPESIITRDEQLFQEHKDVAQKKDELPTQDQLNRVLNVLDPARAREVKDEVRKETRERNKAYNKNEREVNTFARSPQRMAVIHETAEYEGDENTLADLKNDFLDTCYNPASTAAEITGTRNSYFNEVARVNDKMWGEYKQAVEAATQDIENKIRIAKEERDRHEGNPLEFSKKSREVEKLITKRKDIEKSVDQEQNLRLVRAEKLATQHTGALINTIQTEADQPEVNPSEASTLNTINNLLAKKEVSLLVKTIVGAVAGGGTALGAAALVGTGSAVMIPGLIGAGILLSFARGGRIPIISSMLDRNIAKYRLDIARLGADHHERAQKEAILERRLATSRKLKDLSQVVGIAGSFGIAGSVGFIAGALTSVYGTTAGAAAGAGALAGGGTVLASEAFGEYQMRNRPTINLMTELGYTEAELAPAATLLSNGQELQVNKKFGGKVGKLHGRFHSGVMQKVRKEDLNKSIYLAKLLEINSEVIANTNVDIDAKIQEVVAASTVATP